MKKSLLIIIALLCIPYLKTHAKDDFVAYLGLAAEVGPTNMFFSPFNSDAITYRPMLGGGFGGAVTFEFEYSRFLFHSGFGVNYTFNQNFFHIEDRALHPTLIPSNINFKYCNMTEQTTHLYGYVPIKIGMKLQRWYFLAGTKIGFFSMGGSSRSKIDVAVYPQTGSGTEELLKYSSDYASFGYNHLNVILSAEVGLDFNKKKWNENPQQKMDAAQRYREAKRKKSIAELTHYRVALFADYGLNNLQNAELNYRPKGSSVYRDNSMHNFMTGVKVTVAFETPKSKPQGNPYVYLYVKDELTDKPIPGASVQMQRKGAKSVSQKTTDTKRGRIARSLTPGMYWAKVSHSKYCSTDTIHFVHNDDYDTLRISLYPRHTFRIPVIDANTSKPVVANGQFVPDNQKPSISATADQSGIISVELDDRIGYVVKTQANGYYDYCDTIAIMSNDMVIKMIPLPIVKRTFILQNMHFATAQTEILPTSKNAIDLLYKLLTENPTLHIRIVGHTDDVGSTEDNRMLSEGRANNIRQAMIQRGISPARMEVLGKGESEPIVANDSEENRQKNRRVEIEILSGAENINIEQLAQ